MRIVPHTHGGGHNPNYSRACEFLPILCANVEGSHEISMTTPSTPLVRTVELASRGGAFPLLPTGGAGLARVTLFLQHNEHPEPLRLVRQLVAHTAKTPLMKLLIILGANIQLLPDIPHIADCHSLDPLLIQGRDQSCRLLVLDILDLVLKSLELFLFGANQLFLLPGAFLLPADHRVHLRNQFVPILLFGTQQATNHKMGVLSIVRRRHVDLAQIDSRDPRPYGLDRWFEDVGCNGFVLCACPVNNHRFGLLPRPGYQQWSILATVREAEHAILQVNGVALVLNPVIPFASAWGMCVWIILAPFSPGIETTKERFHTCIAGMGVQLIGRKELLQMLWTQPYALAANGPPEKNQRFRVQFTTGMRQCVKLRSLPDMDTSDLIELLRLFWLLLLRKISRLFGSGRLLLATHRWTLSFL